jgi:hypothetical protein
LSFRSFPAKSRWRYSRSPCCDAASIPSTKCGVQRPI